MSRLTLQRIMVRMLFDPAYATRVVEQPRDALAGEDLTEEERSWLGRPDPRAWRTDPERPLRTLTVLLQEFPAAAALVVAAAGAEPLRAFFASPGFHKVITRRGSAAMAFGDYLVELASGESIGDPRIAPLALLEAAIARLRRSYRGDEWAAGNAEPHEDRSEERRKDWITGGTSAGTDAGHRGLYVRSDDLALHEAPAGTADLHDALRALLNAEGPELARLVLAPPADLPDARIDPGGREFLLLERAFADGLPWRCPIGISEVTPEFWSLLSFAATPRPMESLVAEAERLGAAADEAPEIVGGLVEDGLLIETRSADEGIRRA